MLARLRNLQHLRRPAGLALFLAGLAAILWATLRHGDSAAFEPVPVTCLVCGRWGAVDVWRNVVLFVPMGAGLALLGVRPRVAALFGLALSLAVETSQATVLVGRTASLSDLLTNTLGAALGAFLTHRWRAWTLPSPLGARWLTAAAAGAWMAALALTGVGLQWASPPPPYLLNQLRDPTRGLVPFDGDVLAATAAGVPTSTRWLEHPVVPTAPGDTLVLRARVRSWYPPGALRPVIWSFTPAREEMLVFGQHGGSLAFRLRTLSSDVRLSSPTWILADAFPVRGDTVEIVAEVTRDAVRLRSASAGGGVREALLGKRLSLGWTILAPPSTVLPRPTLVSALWLGALVLPLAYWGAQVRGRRWDGMAPVAVAVFAAASAALVGRSFGLAPLDALDWCGLAAGVATGWGLAGPVRRAGGRREERGLSRAA